MSKCQVEKSNNEIKVDAKENATRDVNAAHDRSSHKRVIIVCLVITIVAVMINLALTRQHINELTQRRNRVEEVIQEMSDIYMPIARKVLEEYREYFEILSSGEFAKKETRTFVNEISFNELKGYGEYERHTIRRSRGFGGVLGDAPWHNLEWLSVDEIEAIDQLSMADYFFEFGNIIRVEGQSLLVQSGTYAFVGITYDLLGFLHVGIERNETLREETLLDIGPSPNIRRAYTNIYIEQIEGVYYLHLTLREMGSLPDGHLELRRILLMVAGSTGVIALFNIIKTLAKASNKEGR